MLSSVVLPQPLGPTMAMNSPSAHRQRHVGERQHLPPVALDVIAFGQVLDRRASSRAREPVSPQNAIFALRCSSALTSAPNSCSKKPSFTRRATMLLSTILWKSKAFEIRGDPRIDLLRDDRLDGRRQHVRHAVEDVAVLALGREAVGAK